MVDALASGASELRLVEVQVLSSVPIFFEVNLILYVFKILANDHRYG